MTIILIAGSTGAGKTTYSHKLAADLSAAVYSIDDWMKSLYWQDMPSHPDNNWFLENSQWYLDRIQRCENLIVKNAFARAKFGQKSILDLGFATKEHRKKFIELFQASSVSVGLHYLGASADLRWKRVQQRNQEKAETFVMNVDRGMFDYMESIFEVPTADEGAPLTHVEA